MTHDPGCQRAEHSDAAKRCADAVNLHLSALGFDAMRKFVAVRLSDGRSDGVLYDTRGEAVRHQTDEKRCAYIPVPPNGLNACKAESLLLGARFQYAGGFLGLIDRDAKNGGRVLIPRLTAVDQTRQIAALLARR